MPCEHTASILPARTQTVSLLLWDMSTCLCSSSVFIIKGRIVVRILAFFHLFISVISYLVLLLQYTFVFSGHLAISRTFHCDRIIPGTLVLPTGGNIKPGPGVTWLRRNEERVTRKMGGGERLTTRRSHGHPGVRTSAVRIVVYKEHNNRYY